MARQYKRVLNMYAVWNYQEEMEYLNNASAQGWQLMNVGPYFKFKWNPDVCYRYQIDYTGKVEDMARYLETFREQGWELIRSRGGWHYFRKPYDPTLPESQYEIFTDRSSLAERNRRWIKMVFILGALCAVLTVIQLVHYILEPTLPVLARVTTLGIILGILAYGIAAMKTPEKKRNTRWGSLLLVTMILVGIVGNGASIYLDTSRPYFQCNYVSEETAVISNDLDSALEWTGIEFKYTDNYYLDLEINAEAPIRFTIQNDAGDVVYEVAGSEVSQENIKLKLDAGTYSLRFSDFSGGELNVYLNID